MKRAGELLASLIVTLYCTVPSQSNTTDRTQANYCQNPSTAPTSDVSKLHVYRQASWGGPVSLHLVKDVTGREGLNTSIPVDPGAGAIFWVTVVDTAGNESCASNAVFVPGVVSGVEGDAADPVVETQVFDVHGRLVRKPGNGVYWERRHYRSGKVETKKLVIVR